MSVRIHKSLIDSAKLQLIQKFLFLQPIKVYSARKPPYHQEESDPIIFYRLSGDDILLPFRFASSLMKCLPNEDRVLPRLGFNFQGKLLEDPQRDQHVVVKEALGQLDEYGTTLLALYPGFGKTVLAAHLAARQVYLTLVLFNRTVLLTQWYATFSNYTDARLWLPDQPLPAGDFHVILCMDTQFSKLPDKIKAAVGTLIVDEAHSFCTPGHVDCLLGCQPKKIIMCTATPKREDGMHSIIQLMIGNHQVTRKAQKYHKVVKFRTGVSPELYKNKKGELDWSRLVRDLCEDPKRNELALGMVKSNPDYKICILTWSKPHAFHLQQLLTSEGIQAAVMAGNRKTYSDSRVLVGTISKIGTGFDEQNACLDFQGERINMLIMMGTTKSEPLLEQTLGRAFRAELPHIVIFVDQVAAINKHWYKIKKWCEEHNGEIYEMDAPGVKSGLDSATPELNNHQLGKLAMAQMTALQLARKNQSTQVHKTQVVSTASTPVPAILPVILPTILPSTPST